MTRRNGRGGGVGGLGGSDDVELEDTIGIQSLINKSLEGHNSAIMSFLKMNLQLIDEKLDKVVIDVAELKKSKEFAEGYSADIQKVDTKVKSLQTDVDNIKRTGGVSPTNTTKPLENGTFQLQLEEIKRKLIDIEDRSRRNNLRIDGVSEDQEETWEDTKKKVQNIIVSHFGEEVKLERVHRTGAKTPGCNRTIVAQFSSWTEKSSILNNSSALKNTNISIYEDFCKETVQVRKKLIPEMKKARDAGKFATISYNKLIVKDKRPSGNNTQ